jgi:nucleotide-binding universal stress UspA family protein
MKILLAADGSPSSEARRKKSLPGMGTEIRWRWKSFTVIHSRVPRVADPVLVVAASHQEASQQAPAIAEKTANLIRKKAPSLSVTTKILKGAPKAAIVEEAERWGAGLIVLGCRKYGPVTRFVLGSVAHAWG